MTLIPDLQVEIAEAGVVSSLALLLQNGGTEGKSRSACALGNLASNEVVRVSVENQTPHVKVSQL